MKILLALFVCVLSAVVSSEAQTYNPSQQTTVSRPLGLYGDKPTDGRSYYFDASSFTWRPFNSVSEANTYLKPNSVRGGHFPVFIKQGDSVNIYWYRNGTDDDDLVPLQLSSGTSSDTINGCFTFVPWQEQYVTREVSDTAYNDGKYKNLISFPTTPGVTYSFKFSEITAGVGSSADYVYARLSGGHWSSTDGRYDSTKASAAVFAALGLSFTWVADSTVGSIDFRILSEEYPNPGGVTTDYTGRDTFYFKGITYTYQDISSPTVDRGITICTGQNLDTVYSRAQIDANYYTKDQVDSVVSGSVTDTTSLSNRIDGKVDKVAGKGLSTNDYTTTDKNKLAATASAQALKDSARAIRDDFPTGVGSGDMLKSLYDPTSVAGDAFDYRNFTHTPTIPQINDASASGTSTYSSNKVNSLLSGKLNSGDTAALHDQLANKVDKVSGKGLSTNDYTTTEKNKLSGIASGAEANVQSDLSQTTVGADNFVKNKDNQYLANGRGYLNRDSLNDHLVDLMAPLYFSGDTAIAVDTSRGTHSVATQRQIDSLLALIGGISNTNLGNSNLTLPSGATRNFGINGGSINFNEADGSSRGIFSGALSYMSAQTNANRFASITASTVGDEPYISIVARASSQTSQIYADSSGVSLLSESDNLAKFGRDGSVTLSSAMRAPSGDTVLVGLNEDGKMIKLDRSEAGTGGGGGSSDPLPDLPIQTISGTTHTLALADKNKMNSYTSSSAVTITVPTNASVAFTTGTRIMIVQSGSGQLTFQGASGVTVNSVFGSMNTVGQYSVVELVKMATNTWVLFGALQ